MGPDHHRLTVYLTSIQSFDNFRSALAIVCFGYKCQTMVVVDLFGCAVLHCSDRGMRVWNVTSRLYKLSGPVNFYRYLDISIMIFGIQDLNFGRRPYFVADFWKLVPSTVVDFCFPRITIGGEEMMEWICWERRIATALFPERAKKYSSGPFEVARGNPVCPGCIWCITKPTVAPCLASSCMRQNRWRQLLWRTWHCQTGKT